MRIPVVILCLLFPTQIMAASAPREAVLDPHATGLPYRFEERWKLPRYDLDTIDAQRIAQSGLLIADVDGDGFQEIITARAGAVIAAEIEPMGGGRNLWWSVLPATYPQGWPSAYLAGTADADADGIAEVVVIGADPTYTEFRVRVLRGDTGEAVLDAPLLPTRELHRDGFWDGYYGLAGTLVVPTGAGPRPAYVLFVAAGHDRQPRGLLAVDAETGAILWFHRTAGKPGSKGVAVADLDGDGRSEVIALANAVENYTDDETVDGLRDDTLRVLVLEADGTLRWRVSYPPGGGGGTLAVADLDGDGRAEVLCATSFSGAVTNSVTIYAGADGAVLQSLDQMSPVQGLAVQAPAGERPGRILLSTTREGLASYVWDAGRWTLEHRLTADARIMLLDVADVLPQEGDEILLFLSPERLVVVDERMRALAVSESRNGINTWSVLVPTADGQTFIFQGPSTRSEGTQFALVVAPRTADRRLLLLGALPLAALGAALEHRRRRRQGRSAVLDARDARLQLLGQLELSGHGAIGLLKTLRRVVWLARAAQGGGGMASHERLAELSRECLQRALPTVERMLQLAGVADLEPRLVLRPKESLALVQWKLSQLQRDGFSIDALEACLPDLGAASQDLENDLQRLRREVSACFRCDLGAAVDRVLGLLREEIAAADVQVSVDGPRPAWLRFDAEELAFILDNLIQNALRAMATGEKTLRLSWRHDEGVVVLDVSDTGAGIVPDDWERIFDPGFTTRAGGGLGLGRSRDLLRKYEGTIAVHDSALGRGTTMRLRLAAARDMA